MFKTNKERLEVYHVAVANYSRTLFSFRELEKNQTGKISLAYNQAKFEHLSRLQIKLRAMEDVMGLTHEEKITIFKKFGLGDV